MFRKPFYKAFVSDVIKVEFFKSSMTMCGIMNFLHPKLKNYKKL